MKYVVAICTVEAGNSFAVRSGWEIGTELGARSVYAAARSRTQAIGRSLYDYAVGAFDRQESRMVAWALIRAGRIVRSWGWL